MELQSESEFERYLASLGGNLDALMADIEIITRVAPVKLTIQVRNDSEEPGIVAGGASAIDFLQADPEMELKEAAARADALDTMHKADAAEIIETLMFAARDYYVEERSTIHGDDELEDILYESLAMEARLGTVNWVSFAGKNDGSSIKLGHTTLEGLTHYDNMELFEMAVNDGQLIESLFVIRLGNQITSVQKHVDFAESKLSMEFFNLFPEAVSQLERFLKGNFGSEQEIEDAVQSLRTHTVKTADTRSIDYLLGEIRGRAVMAMHSKQLEVHEDTTRPSPSEVSEFRDRLDGLLVA